jgi:hypothetical protein
MRPLIKTTVWGERGDIGVNLGNVSGSPIFTNIYNGLTDGVNGVISKIKSKVKKYKNTHIVDFIAPYIVFGRKGRTPATPESNYLFFINNWGNPRYFQGSPRVHPGVTSISKLLKSFIFFNYRENAA